MRAPGEVHLLVLVGDDRSVHLLGDFHELDLPMKCHQREIERFGDGADRRGKRRRVHPKLDNHSDRARVCQPFEVTAGRSTQGRPCGEDELAAL